MTNTLGLYPLMKKSEIRAIEKQLVSFDKKIINVLEWGSGGSTHHFTSFLKEKNINYNWISLEYNKLWFDKVKDKVKDDDNISIYLFDVGNNNLKQRYINMDDYVNFPLSLNKKFDLIIVDGRKRRRCVIEAKKMITDQGVVFLHDAQRKYYRCVFKEFNDSTLLGPSLWRGTKKNISGVVKLINFIRIIFFLFYFNFIILPIRIIGKKILFFIKIK